MGNVIEIKPTEEEHEEMLNECFGEVEICGMTFDSGRVLRELDPTAFRCSMADEPTQYKCDECDTMHDDYEEAENCCIFTCENCGDEHPTEEEAENCCSE